MISPAGKGEGSAFERIVGTILFWILVAFLLTGLYHAYARPFGLWIRGSL